MALGEVLADFIANGEYATVDQQEGGSGFMVLDGSMTVDEDHVDALIAAGAERL